MTNPTAQKIAPRQRVTFDDAQEGPQSGVVLDILTNLLNGQATATIEVDFALPGVIWHVPVIDLTPSTTTIGARS